MDAGTRKVLVKLFDMQQITFHVKGIIPLIVLSFCSTIVRSQGCSDAGFCTINGFKPSTDNLPTTTYNNQFRIGTSGGAADHDITVFSAWLEYSRQINKSVSLDTKLAFLSQSGNDISAAGLSDLYINVNYAVSKKAGLVIGTKIPFNDANQQKNGLPLPMDYQSSLGTFDLIVGLSYKLEKWKFNVGWQQPLNKNNNTFIAEDYPVHSPLHSFQSTNNYLRRGDVLLRVSYLLTLSNKLLFTPGLLPIYHLKNDAFTNLNGKQIINGSRGLTLNANAFLNYTINAKTSLECSVGAPLVARDVRPDGLTRRFVASLQYQVSF